MNDHQLCDCKQIATQGSARQEIVIFCTHKQSAPASRTFNTMRKIREIRVRFMRHHDAIIIGAGHNGVTAAYLARFGKRVLVLERRHLMGGACVTETDVFNGFRVSTTAYVNSLFRKEIIRDLVLEKHGFTMLKRNTPSFTPLPESRHLFLGSDARQNLSEIAKFPTRDAGAYPSPAPGYRQLPHARKGALPLCFGNPSRWRGHRRGRLELDA
jgi:hypothetical protein